MPSDRPPSAAVWSRWQAFLRGLLFAFHVPGIVLCGTAMGYGALARDAGFELGQTLLISASFYALPAQVIFVDQMARGASLAAAAFAVTLTAVRLLPMTVSMMPYLRDPELPRCVVFPIVHFMAVTSWIEGNRVLPGLAVGLRVPHYAGIGFGMLGATLCGSVIGYMAAGVVPTEVAAALLFMTPLYFIMSLFGAMRDRADMAAIGLGCVLGPAFYLLVPGLDLLATGLVGGTIAFLIGRRRS